MSITSIERLTERGGNLGQHFKINQTYLVRTNSREDGYFEIKEAIEGVVGGFLSAHPESSFYTRRGIDITAQSPLHWTAKVVWSTEPVSNQDKEKEQFPNPLDRSARISLASQETQKYVWKDRNDAPLQNSALDPIAPLPTDFTDVMINISQNIPSYLASWITTYGNTVNNSTIKCTDGYAELIIEKEYGLLKRLSISELQEENGYKYYTASAQVHITHDMNYKWKTMVIDEGFKNIVGELITITDDNGNEAKPTDPVKLDGEGSKLAQGSEPFLLEFELYKQSDWSGLPFFYT